MSTLTFTPTPAEVCAALIARVAIPSALVSVPVGAAPPGLRPTA